MKLLISTHAKPFAESTRQDRKLRFLSFVETSNDALIEAPTGDIVNAKCSHFYGKIWDREKNNASISPQSLAEIKAFELCHAEDPETINNLRFDLTYLINKHRVSHFELACPYMTSDINKFLNSIEWTYKQ